MDYLDKIIQSLYSWEGRISRLEYFSYGLLASIISCVLLSIISPLLDIEGSFFVVISIVLLLSSILNSIYTGIVLVIKRLRDMGFDTVHVWWIGGLWLVSSIHSWGDPESTVTYSLLGLDILVSLWLLFSPSKK